MKSYHAIIIISACFLMQSSVFSSFGQNTALQGFSLKVSPGSMVYSGDLSTNDLNLPKRILTASKFGFNAGIVKQFTPYFGIQVQFLAGNLYNEASDNTYFAASLTEFSIAARFDPLKLIKGTNYRLSPYLSVGVGTFGFRSVRRDIGTNLVLLPTFGYNTDGVTKSNRQSAMSMPIAVGLSYRVLPYLTIELEHALRLTNTDLLDCFKGLGTANDMYSLTSIGLRFTLPTKPNKPTKAHSVISKDDGAIKKPIVEKSIPVTDNLDVSFDIAESMQPGQTYEGRITIKKGKYNGTARLVQKFPDGLTAIDNQTKNPSLTFANQNVYIEWLKLPADSIVIYNYQVKVAQNLSGSQTITGKLEYQPTEGAKTVRFNKTVFVESSKIAEEKEVSSNQVQKQNDLNETEAKAPVTKGNIREAKPLTGVEFRVQCGAFRDKNSADTQLAAKYRITEIIQEEFTDGWYKYTVGSFRTYEEASNYKELFIARTKISTAFIVAYRDGRRLAKISEAFK